MYLGGGGDVRNLRNETAAFYSLFNSFLTHHGGCLFHFFLFDADTVKRRADGDTIFGFNFCENLH